jgi:hypothetical protein
MGAESGAKIQKSNKIKSHSSKALMFENSKTCRDLGRG